MAMHRDTIFMNCYQAKTLDRMKAAQTPISQCDAAWKALIAAEHRAELQHGLTGTVLKPVDATYYNDYNDIDVDTLNMMHFGRSPVPAKAARRGHGSHHKVSDDVQARIKKLEREVADCKRKNRSLQKQALAITGR